MMSDNNQRNKVRKDETDRFYFDDEFENMDEMQKLNKLEGHIEDRNFAMLLNVFDDLRSHDSNFVSNRSIGLSVENSWKLMRNITLQTNVTLAHLAEEVNEQRRAETGMVNSEGLKTDDF